jgi:hypothetical protein
MIGKCEHSWVEVGYANEGLTYLCEFCPSYTFFIDEDWSKQTFPINPVLQKTPDDCSVACVAMLLDLDYDRAFELCREHLNERLDSPDNIRANNYMAKFLISQGLDVREIEYSGHYSQFSDLCKSDDVCLVTVEKWDGSGGHYVIYHDNLVYCPQLGVVDSAKYFNNFTRSIFTADIIKQIEPFE